MEFKLDKKTARQFRDRRKAVEAIEAEEQQAGGFD